jgi:chromate transporter
MTRIFEVFYRFLALGCISFGGPAAHIGYFQTAFVQKLKWLDQEAYAKLVALSQFLPGPGSSQVGFAIGLRRAGLAGGIAAFLGFTLPSFILLYLLATLAFDGHASQTFDGVVQGLKLLAVVVVANASLSMFKSFCKDRLTISLMVASTVCLLLISNLWTQVTVLLFSAIIGAILATPSKQKQNSKQPFHIKRVSLGLFFVLFFGLPLVGANLLSSFYQAGSLVFGGGHVVLPLLQQTVGNNITTDQFLTGYAAAQAIPGPMFALASFLGAELMPEQPLLGASMATLALFLPGFLLMYSLQDTWESLMQNPRLAGAAAAINAAVVGLLISALYHPIFTSAVTQRLELAIVMLGFMALRIMKVPIFVLVIAMSAIGIFLQ